jgi:hypothetical protein
MILSGLDYHKDLSFLLLNQATLTFTNKSMSYIGMGSRMAVARRMEI